MPQFDPTNLPLVSIGQGEYRKDIYPDGRAPTPQRPRRTLFDISNDLLALDQLIEEHDGDISDPEVAAAIEAWFAELDRDLVGKTDNYAMYIRELTARANARKLEADRLANRARVDQNLADTLRAKLKEVFEARSIKKLDTPRFRVSVCSNGGKLPVLIPDEAAIPREHCRVIYRPDTDKIRELLIAGISVQGASLGKRGTHLRIA